jgi:hypothetical protein
MLISVLLMPFSVLKYVIADGIPGLTSVLSRSRDTNPGMTAARTILNVKVTRDTTETAMTMPPGLVSDTPPSPPPAKPPPFRIDAPEGSELDDLLAQREMAKAAAAEADGIATALDTRVKQLLGRLLPRGAGEIEVPGTRYRSGVRMSFRRKRMTDMDRLRAEHPEINFDSYLQWGRPYFEITKLGS